MKEKAYIEVTDKVLRSWPLPSLAQSSGKEDRGRVVVVGGARQVPGAALLAGEAVLRVGAGKLHIATTPSARSALGIAVPEAMVSTLEEDDEGNLTGGDDAFEKALGSADAVLVGPGLTSCASSAGLVRQILQACRCPLVLDAGALEEFRSAPRLTAGRIITPHFGEMARLMDRPIQVIAANPAAVALELARETDSVVVLKSPETYIAAPDGGCWVHLQGSVGLGTSGSGDVLAGMIAGLLARGADLNQAAVWGVRLHGKAGERLSKEFGAVGFLARELSPCVPGLLKILDRSNFASALRTPA